MLPSRLTELQTRWVRRLWSPESLAGGGVRTGLVRVLRIVHCIARDLAQGELTLRAMSLVYTTILSLVPLLAVVFSVLKAFEVYRRAEPLLANFLSPLGDRGSELTRQIIEWVENMRAGVLGGIGVAFLIWAVLSLIQKIESALNYSWHVSRKRKLAKRFGDFLSIVLIGPVLLISALGVLSNVMETRWVSSLLSIEPLGALVRIGSHLLPYLLAIAAFALIYVFVPNTKVRWRSALVGAVLGGIAWQALGWAFASFVVSLPTFAGVYSGLAIVLLFMIWLYLNWLIILLGANVAFYHQHPEYLGIDRHNLRLSGRLREKLALLVMYLVAKRHYEDGGKPWSADALAARARLPSDVALRILDALESAGLLAVSGDDDDEYLPARALEKLRLRDVLDAVRTNEESPLFGVDSLPPEPVVDELADRIESAYAGVLGETTLRDLVRGSGVRDGDGDRGEA